MPKRICKKCGRKLKQQFVGVYHCKCGNTRMNGTDIQRTPDTVFALERRKVGKKVKQVPVVRSATKDEKEPRKENLYFAVYSYKTEDFQHTMVCQTSKKIVGHQLRNKGKTVHYVFNKNDVMAIKNGHFCRTDVTEEVIAYLVEHIAEWDKIFLERSEL